MRLIKPYNEFTSKTTNEEITYRNLSKISDFASIPKFLLDKLLSKILNYIPDLDSKYKVLAVKKLSQFGPSYSIPSTINDDIKKVDIDDIQNDKLKRTLKISGILTKWNVYIVNVVNDKNASQRSVNNSYTKVYITKDEIKKGDVIHSRRISDKGLGKDIMLIVCAKKTEQHSKLRNNIDQEFADEQVEDFKKDIRQRMDNNRELPEELIKKYHKK